ncbi:DUF4421 domain-containing protein [Panacibacter ginsenosidivorans]|uniref:DUF4421 domain-containing protein n=1 Tax=Panacibacter ginsenosidivorans TaxID=1813871 RepID=A0A5B8VAJ8_9BACT|nr:DUF4421 domain-containing protein [Panacibacter ginsenosidivorans]QEC67716.1 DUF4421 domain-containing protein [Panacibacter ginsenosidivorans]
MKNNKLYQLLTLATCLLFLMAPHQLFAQHKPGHDSIYFTTYPQRLTTRFYFSKKYTSVTFPAADKQNDLTYRANTPLTMGVGATYNNLSLNLSYGFGFLNPDDEKGKTKSIDLELHVYPYKWAIDVLGIHHKGMHIEPKGYAAVNANNYYYRPDVIMTLGGISAYRVINNDRFSYNAAMIQSEWQKRSAGSLLYGGEIYYGSIKADSSLVPVAKTSLFEQAGVDKMQFFTAGIGAGYAYTLVIEKHLFVMGSAIANIDINLSDEHNGNNQNKHTAVTPSFIYKAAVGYNSHDWVISANWAANTLWVNGESSARSYMIPTGNYRFILAKRIGIKRK